MRSALVKLLGAITLLGALLSAAVLAYGLLQGPPAPIRPSGDGFRDRLGNAYTAEEYADHQRWQRRLFMAFGATILAGFAWAALDRKRRPGELSDDERRTLEATVDRVGRVLPVAAAELRARGPLAGGRREDPGSERTGPGS